MGIWKYALLVFLGGCSYGSRIHLCQTGIRRWIRSWGCNRKSIYLGAIMLWICAIFVPKIRLNAKQWLILIVSGMPMGLTGIFYNRALEYIDASFAIILLLQFTWMGMVLQLIFEKQTPSRKSVIATVLILLGSILASGFLSSGMTFSLAGISWGTACGVILCHVYFYKWPHRPTDSSDL